jgi:DNA-binding NarL/FixJ family response regulator
VPLSASDRPSVASSGKKQVFTDSGAVIRVLLADDHTFFRDGLARMLKKEPDIKVVGHAKDGQEAVNLAGKLKPDVILMDISMPIVNGIEATRIIHREHPNIRIIGLSMYDDQERAQAMRDAGVSDYLDKGCEASALVSAIRDCVLQQ